MKALGLWGIGPISSTIGGTTWRRAIVVNNRRALRIVFNGAFLDREIGSSVPLYMEA
ncbi:hypothetical protein [Pannonibacter tanglangensis]|uniref:Uncharacterized protein n=1 Tax=Pannonibacter tanglangensis TaxID=2750084 RepID=A0ABW9ZD53_9HYPH|nr:hypothetical protein [Pannonibacter sp. XCT-34]NBN62765.1 hypothetical protein [Pannonibacter sp. XCT-34]